MDKQYTNADIRAYLMCDSRILNARITDGGWNVEVLEMTQVGIYRKPRWNKIGTRASILVEMAHNNA